MFSIQCIYIVPQPECLLRWGYTLGNLTLLHATVAGNKSPSVSLEYCCVCATNSMPLMFCGKKVAWNRQLSWTTVYGKLLKNWMVIQRPHSFFSLMRQLSSGQFFSSCLRSAKLRQNITAILETYLLVVSLLSMITLTRVYSCSILLG